MQYFDLKIPQYSNQAVGTYSIPIAKAMNINNIPQFDGYTFDSKSGKYYKSDINVDPRSNQNEFNGYGFTADQLLKFAPNGSQDNSQYNSKFPSMTNLLPEYTSPEHQYNALSNMMTPNDIMNILTASGKVPAGAGRFANTNFTGLLGGTTSK